jgi:guanine deaminase
MPCVTPRFVPTCTPTMMARLGELSLRYGLPVQSHLSESQGEIDWVSSLHPDCSTYADVYDKYGLLHSSSYMAHCCHSSPEERVLLSQRETGVVHCASSNFMLSSGVMDVRTFLGEGINVALGTDVAGGYSPSMLDALRQCIVASRVKSFDHRQAAWVAAMSVAATVSYDDNAAETRSTSTESSTSEVHGAHTKATGGGPTAEDVAVLQQFSADYRPLTYSEAFHLATMGGAEVLGMGDVLGNFLAGKKLDCLVVDVDVANSPIDTFEGEGPLDHFQKFLFLGDDRNVQHVFVDGVMVI